ncbi:MAG TPA: PAS domain-containing protein [Steroidobacteraceae bacterium]|jgi:PAS domain S-box-containing protein|nr:PAS domain-containing protein [Steroidobacteraceae bacterium]
MPIDASQAALVAVNHISAMVAYWDSNQQCVFSNNAYREWFGRTPEEMVGMSMRELLGPLYPKNLPYILAALKGEKQVFERRIPLPGGEVRDTIATYTPDIFDGTVRGFWVHVADVTSIRQRETELERTIQERDAALAEVRTLRGLLPICSVCKSIRDESGTWQTIEQYVSDRSDASFTHGICPSCIARLYPDVDMRDIKPKR